MTTWLVGIAPTAVAHGPAAPGSVAAGVAKGDLWEDCESSVGVFYAGIRASAGCGVET